MKRLFVLALIAIIGGCTEFSPSRGRLVINEIMVRNSSSTGIVSPDGDAADYVELFNAGHDTVWLQRYFLSDQRENPTRSLLPIQSLAPGEFALFYGGNSSLHQESSLGFKLSSDSRESLYLFDSLMQIVDSIAFHSCKKALKKGTAYGRLSDGGTHWVVQKNPTPGKSNKE